VVIECLAGNWMERVVFFRQYLLVGMKKNLPLCDCLYRFFSFFGRPSQTSCFQSAASATASDCLGISMPSDNVIARCDVECRRASSCTGGNSISMSNANVRHKNKLMIFNHCMLKV
jgi:hypothetical protein